MKHKDIKITQRLVNAVVRKLNKQIHDDVFKDRFEMRQANRCRTRYGTNFFQFKLIDNEDHTRDKLTAWFSEIEILNFSDIYIEMNDFIVTSDFWKKWKESGQHE